MSSAARPHVARVVPSGCLGGEAGSRPAARAASSARSCQCDAPPSNPRGDAQQHLPLLHESPSRTGISATRPPISGLRWPAGACATVPALLLVTVSSTGRRRRGTPSPEPAPPEDGEAQGHDHSASTSTTAPRATGGLHRGHGSEVAGELRTSGPSRSDSASVRCLPGRSRDLAVRSGCRERGLVQPARRSATESRRKAAT